MTEFMVCGRTRNRGNELLGIRMMWRRQYLFGGAAFDDLSTAHDQHPLADTTHHRQIVAHEQICHSELVAELGEQVEDDRLHADVQ